MRMAEMQYFQFASGSAFACEESGQIEATDAVSMIARDTLAEGLA